MNIQRSSPSLASLKVGLIRRFSLNVSEHQRQNHYDCLGITPKATQGDIKAAYYKLSKQCHPDLSKGDDSAAEKFRKISAAYEVLGNVKSRKTYDRGLLIGTHDLEYDSQEPVDTYRHASFYHHRNKPISRKTQTGTSTHYNIDEWTRAHYSKTFQKSYQKKSEAYNIKFEEENMIKDNRTSLPVFSLFIILAAFFFTYATNPGNKYDLESKFDKPD